MWGRTEAARLAGGCMDREVRRGQCAEARNSRGVGEVRGAEVGRAEVGREQFVGQGAGRGLGRGGSP